ncbi:MAG: (Dimethylallyl)adenosine tRNA methylthiotransferase MiaB [Candidatus Methanofastidiosum methylothiophilum]|uniref:tRNA-t(6)A37 methylthiotransferase n=1 Tax=Candidatus Methanofastidiosum methylothiophilum TaxID=1705564 RepID=A0A150IRB0_9EURY|nr:MAG: (Dimethylallyl)adenosine tRNA methylthiotransferase MiaB [Candidatus Methanofastidiosum methylthiophilus]KYC47569.1 MAG: (Dimethylallyl)adenosine tRNA methylthiotransferase MiaB [Candidatus Methanofastidiosum methylthiophilus]KYC50163.1 MAG: (Dimethylallyl)adenosine tRNA methylthiotransferase MiaB [Candidatus Methanofastidiosum methylthiophilus]
MQHKIFVETYGCTQNKGDSEILKYLLKDYLVESVDEADTVIINTCGVKGQTEKKIILRISSLINSKRVIVSGCLPKINLNAIDERVSGIIGTNDLDHILDVVNSKEKLTLISEDNRRLGPKTSFKKIRDDSTSAIVQISEGCAGACSFCCTRFARGRVHSFPIQEIVNEVKEALSEGYREILFTSQDTAAYGLDTGETLTSLLKNTFSIDEKFMLRLGMANPNHIKSFEKELVELYKDPHMYRFLHIPVQSGDDRVLLDMKRGHKIKEFLDTVSLFRKNIEDLYLCTDVIVGFPTEDEAAFENTYKLVEKIRPDKINLTRFSPRPGTDSSKMNQIPTWIVKERSRRLNLLRKNISSEINKSYVGRNFEALITEKNKDGTYTGRIYNNKPVILEDGNVGDFIDVIVEDATSTYLIGRR